MRTHYDNLGIPRESTSAQIRSAYRRIVLEHHPDKSDSADSRHIFLTAKQSYEVLTDPMKKRSYDCTLDLLTTPPTTDRPDPKPPEERDPTPRGAAPKPSPKPQPSSASNRPAPAAEPTIPQRLAQLQSLFGHGRFADAEKLAKAILEESAKEAIPYAVLGDIARAQGDINEAARFYAYAAQFAPTNPIYQRRYEELLDRSQVTNNYGNYRIQASESRVVVPMLGGGLVLACASYLVLQSVPSPAPSFTVSSATMGLVSGIAVGASLSVGNLLERFQTETRTTQGRMGLAVGIGVLAMANLWLAVLAYVILGSRQKSFSISMTRLLSAVVAATVVLALASIKLSMVVMFLFGGSIIFVGAVCGWMVADAFRG